MRAEQRAHDRADEEKIIGPALPEIHINKGQMFSIIYRFSLPEATFHTFSCLKASLLVPPSLPSLDLVFIFNATGPNFIA